MTRQEAPRGYAARRGRAGVTRRRSRWRSGAEHSRWKGGLYPSAGNMWQGRRWRWRRSAHGSGGVESLTSWRALWSWRMQCFLLRHEKIRSSIDLTRFICGREHCSLCVLAYLPTMIKGVHRVRDHAGKGKFSRRATKRCCIPVCVMQTSRMFAIWESISRKRQFTELFLLAEVEAALRPFPFVMNLSRRSFPSDALSIIIFHTILTYSYRLWLNESLTFQIPSDAFDTSQMDFFCRVSEFKCHISKSVKRKWTWSLLRLAPAYLKGASKQMLRKYNFVSR